VALSTKRNRRSQINSPDICWTIPASPQLGLALMIASKRNLQLPQIAVKLGEEVLVASWKMCHSSVIDHTQLRQAYKTLRYIAMHCCQPVSRDSTSSGFPEFYVRENYDPLAVAGTLRPSGQ